MLVFRFRFVAFILVLIGLGFFGESQAIADTKSKPVVTKIGDKIDKVTYVRSTPNTVGTKVTVVKYK